MIKMVLKLKIAIFAAKLQKSPSGWGALPQAFVIGMFELHQLVSTGPKLDNFLQKFSFGSSPSLLAKSC